MSSRVEVRQQALGVLLFGFALARAGAQRSAEPARRTWEVQYAPKYFAGTTASERSAIMATLGQSERIPLWKAYQTLDWAALKRIVDRSRVCRRERRS